MKAEEVKFRCSSLGHLMTEPRSKSEKLGESCKMHLVDVFVSAKYGRREDATGKMLEKGNAREEDSITLLSRTSKQFYTKNDIRLTNEYISGEPDLFKGIKIEIADETLDTKTSWSAHTFWRARTKELDKMYYWQGQGYMALTGAKVHTVAFCLVNGLPGAIQGEKRRLQWASPSIDPDTDLDYISKAKQVEINHIFDIEHFVKENPGFDFDNDVEAWQKDKTWDIPMEERIYLFTVKRDDTAISALYSRIIDCRAWMDENLFNLPQKQILTADSQILS